MSNPFKTRTGGATVTVFAPYDCNNHCPFCINKEEYADTSDFSLEKIINSIREVGAFTPYCDFAFTGGEPMANLESLQLMLDAVAPTHRVFINTTLPVMNDYSEDEVVAFLNRNKDKITCVNVSRHLHKYVEESRDELFGRLEVPVRVNCVLFHTHSPQRMLEFVRRFEPWNIPIQFRADYTKTTPENLYDEAADDILWELRSVFRPTEMEGCRIRCNYEFLDGKHVVSYHKTLPYSTMTVTDGEGRTYDILYDVLIKQNGDFHSDWTGVLMNLEDYKKVIFEPYDLHRIY
ncbi:MAG: radical SAM protein [Oscillospiraceae bacterium]|nr:radical SAM protein [Oscillospiraceae bacterium]MBR4693122.1 radical SAM protein [Oscillospiraceae bacterium]